MSVCHIKELNQNFRHFSGNAEFAGVDKAGVDNSAPYCRDAGRHETVIIWHQTAGGDGLQMPTSKLHLQSQTWA